MLKKLFTKNLKQIPLLWIVLNLKHYRENGKKGSCMLNIHPNLRHDEYIEKTLNDLVDYIREKYDMENM